MHWSYESSGSMRKLFFIFTGLLITQLSHAEQDAMVFWYQEKEAIAQPVMMRYVVTDDFMRIDEGNINDDYILFDADKKEIYSINQQDQTILHIKNFKWEKPDFSFDTSVVVHTLDDAPQIAGKQVQHYQLKAVNDVCTSVQFVPGMFKNEMKMFYDYQAVLSGQQAQVVACLA